MKRTFALCLGLTALVGLLTLAVVPAQAQTEQKMGKIHGVVINPTGQPQGGGTVSLSTDGGATMKYNFTVSSTGEYSGEAEQGTYMLVYRAPDTPEGKQSDSIRGI